MTSPDTDLLLLEQHAAGYAVITLNRPQAMNALSRALMNTLADTVDRLAADPAVRVLVLAAHGRAFCAGLDLKEIGAGQGSVGGRERARDPVQALARFDGPVIGAINGAAVTGGFELALACDVLLASPQARFADTHARVGIAPGWGLSQKLSRIIGPSRAKEASFTGNWISAEQAAAWGLVSRVVPADDLLPQARQLAQDMLGTLPHMLRHYKSVIDDGYALAYGEGLLLERQRANTFNAQVDPSGVEERREAVRERNRHQ